MWDENGTNFFLPPRQDFLAKFCGAGKDAISRLVFREMVKLRFATREQKQGMKNNESMRDARNNTTRVFFLSISFLSDRPSAIISSIAQAKENLFSEFTCQNVKLDATQFSFRLIMLFARCKETFCTFPW